MKEYREDYQMSFSYDNGKILSVKSARSQFADERIVEEDYRISFL